jgi:hypothetical protein
MKQIDEKLGQLSKNETHIGSRPPTLFKKFATAANRENKVQIQKPYHFFSRRTQSFKDQEKKIEDTQKEIMIALERLESKGLDEKQARVQISNKKNKDALASFEKC